MSGTVTLALALLVMVHHLYTEVVGRLLKYVWKKCRKDTKSYKDDTVCRDQLSTSQHITEPTTSWVDAPIPSVENGDQDEPVGHSSGCKDSNVVIHGDLQLSRSSSIDSIVPLLR